MYDNTPPPFHMTKFKDQLVAWVRWVEQIRPKYEKLYGRKVFLNHYATARFGLSRCMGHTTLAADLYSELSASTFPFEITCVFETDRLRQEANAGFRPAKVNFLITNEVCEWMESLGERAKDVVIITDNASIDVEGLPELPLFIIQFL